jgi:hypothetical protein
MPYLQDVRQFIAAKSKNPGQTELVGADDGRLCPCRRGSQRRELSSHIAVKASDCFQIYQGWLPDERLNKQTTKEYARGVRQTRQCFQSQPVL